MKPWRRPGKPTYYNSMKRKRRPGRSKSKLKLEKAIELLTIYAENSRIDLIEDEYDAMKLGIEALKLIKRNRRYTPQPYNVKLPGEDQE